MIYLDNAATSPVCTEALDAVLSAASCAGNPSSLHAAGREVRALVEKGRDTLARSLGCPADCVVFTSGGTESINTALRGAAAAYGRRKKHIVTTALEHPATRKTLIALHADGFEVTEVEPDNDGRICPHALAAAVREDTCLVTAVLVSSESGALLDAQTAAAEIKKKNGGTLFHLDAVQGFLKTPLLPVAWGVDFVSISSHKFHGPMGVGALFISPSVRFTPLLTGGAQQKGRRAGTEPVPLIAGMAAAVEAWKPVPEELKEHALARLSRIEGCVILPPHDAPHILSAAFPGAPGEVLVRMLSDEGIAVGSGSACSGGHRSHALTAMRLPAAVLDSVVRLSFSRCNTTDEIDLATDALSRAARRITGR